jgi:hypothetical protein
VEVLMKRALILAGRGCHKSQKEAWLETVHAKAYDSLKPKKFAKEKKKAKLDPDKDYTKDKKCIGCHVTGFGKVGGFRTKLPKAKAKFLKDVGCESCHGPGSLYRKAHRKASNKFKKTKKKSPRKTLVKLRRGLQQLPSELRGLWMEGGERTLYTVYTGCRPEVQIRLRKVG